MRLHSGGIGLGIAFMVGGTLGCSGSSAGASADSGSSDALAEAGSPDADATTANDSRAEGSSSDSAVESAVDGPREAALDAPSDVGPPPACEGGLVSCGAACVDTQTDTKNCGACGHDCLGGACTAGQCQPVVLASNQAQPLDVVVDSAHAYWVCAGWTVANAGSVNSVPLAGGAPTALVPVVGGNVLAVDANNVYFAADAIAVGSVPLSGGTPTVLAPADMTNSNVMDLTLDATYVYFARNSTQEIERVPKVGGTVTNLAQPLSNQGPWGIATDGTNVYWAEEGLPNGFVRTVPVGGGTPMTFATTGSAPTFIGVDVNNVYWIANASIFQQAKTGGSATTLASMGDPRDVAMDGSYVYWPDGAGGTINKVPIGGGPVTQLASGQNDPAAIAVDAASIYWVNEGTVGNSDGSVMRVAK